MSRLMAKKALKYYEIHDLLVRANDRCLSEVNTLATKAATINFPRLIKRCLIDLPTSLEENLLSRRRNLIQSIRDLYYSGKDRATFNHILALTQTHKKGLLIDNVASPFYSDISQLPECFDIATGDRRIPKGCDSWIFESFKHFHKLRAQKSSLLFELLEKYDAENDIDRLIPKIELQAESFHHLHQTSPQEKDAMFDPFTCATKKSSHNLNSLRNTLAHILKCDTTTRDTEDVSIKFDHTVVRGMLIYTELFIGKTLFGCGLDRNRQFSTQRATKMAFLNPHFETWAKNKRGDSQRQKLFREAKQLSLSSELAQLQTSPAHSQLGSASAKKFFF